MKIPNAAISLRRYPPAQPRRDRFARHAEFFPAAIVHRNTPLPPSLRCSAYSAIGHRIAPRPLFRPRNRGKSGIAKPGCLSRDPGRIRFAPVGSEAWPSGSALPRFSAALFHALVRIFRQQTFVIHHACHHSTRGETPDVPMRSHQRAGPRLRGKDIDHHMGSVAASRPGKAAEFAN